MRGYLASILFADEMLGRVMDAVEQSPFKDELIIILWSDHGWHLGEKLHWRKFALWEEATRVPLVIKVPGLTTPGSVSDRPVNLIDLGPTLYDVCGIPERDDIAGRTLRPLLEAPDMDWPYPSLSTYKRGNHAVRDQDFRYIRYDDGGEELYDHRKDPMEFDNIADDPSMAETKKRLAEWFPKKNAKPKPRAGADSNKQRKCKNLIADED